MMDLGVFPGGSFTIASGINNRGQVSGHGDLSGQDTAFIWEAGVMTPLIRLPDGRANGANAINGRGHAVGFSLDASDLPHAVLWRDDTITDLEPLAGVQSSAYAVNRRDEAVGFSTAITGGSIAFLWKHGRRFNLGTLTATAPNQVPSSSAVSINQEGRIVGASTTAAGEVHAVLWPSERGIIDLGTAGGANSTAHCINNRGDIVGSSDTASGASHAVLWTKHRADDDQD